MQSMFLNVAAVKPLEMVGQTLKGRVGGGANVGGSTPSFAEALNNAAKLDARSRSRAETLGGASVKGDAVDATHTTEDDASSVRDGAAGQRDDQTAERGAVAQGTVSESGEAVDDADDTGNVDESGDTAATLAALFAECAQYADDPVAPVEATAEPTFAATFDAVAATLARVPDVVPTRETTEPDAAFVSILESQEEIGSLYNLPSADAANASDEIDLASSDAQALFSAIAAADDAETSARTPKVLQQGGTGESVTTDAAAVVPYPLENTNEQDGARQDGDAFAASDESATTGQPQKKSAADDVRYDAVPRFSDVAARRILSVETLAERALTRPVEAANMFEQLVERVEIMRGQNVDSITVQMKPDALGSVALKLSSDANGLHVQISADNASVKSALDARLSSLVQSLEDRGIRVTDVNVVYSAAGGGLNADLSGRGTPNEAGEDRRGTRRGIELADAVGAAQDAFTEQDLLTALGVSSVAYSA